MILDTEDYWKALGELTVKEEKVKDMAFQMMKDTEFPLNISKHIGVSEDNRKYLSFKASKMEWKKKSKAILLIIEDISELINNELAVHK